MKENRENPNNNVKFGFIYIIKNTVNNKVYIGQTQKPLQKRFAEHLAHRNQRRTKLAKAMNEIGADNFYIEELCKVPISELDDAEEYFVDKYNSFREGYNGKRGGKSGNITRPEEDEKIVALAKSGWSREHIAMLFNITKGTVSRILHANGFKYPKIIEDTEREKIISLFDSGKSSSEIAKELKRNKKVIQKHLVNNGRGEENVQIRMRNDFDINEFKRDYQNQMTIKEMCKKYKITKNTIYRLKNKYGIPNRPQLNFRQKPVPKIEVIEE